MNFLRFAKHTVTKVLDAAGLNRKLINSAWRQRRLLIICWHGISNDDEHAWNPQLFMPVEAFRARLQIIRDMRCNVLPLSEALVMVKSASLPPRAVCLTVDDGDSSFYLRAWPMLREFGFPATLYWTTYYSIHPYAVFDPMLSYLLWKGRSHTLALGEPGLRCGLESAIARANAFSVIQEFAKAEAWTAERKERFLKDLASQLKIDYARLKSRRVLHLISPEEARLMFSQGLDLQLHTHRHRVSRNPAEFAAELADNRRVLCESGSGVPTHFCYPSGSYLPDFAYWLRNEGIKSATTCDSGLVQGHMNPYFLPRLVDQYALSQAEFRGWLSGIAAVLRGRNKMDSYGFR